MKKGLFYGTAIALTLTGLYFFLYKGRFLRKPKRNIPNDDSLFVSPAMGKIVTVHKFDTESVIEDKYDDEDNIAGAVKLFAGDVSASGTIISTHLSLTDVHFQRCPVSARVIKIKYALGNFKNAISKSKDGRIRYENEHCSILFETESGYRFKVVQIAGFVARKIHAFVNEGDFVEQGKVIGVIKMGSQVTIVLPEEIDVLASVGEKVIDGESVLGVIKK
jgi:phosphatidylserine decarboxylase